MDPTGRLVKPRNLELGEQAPNNLPRPHAPSLTADRMLALAPLTDPLSLPPAADGGPSLQVQMWSGCVALVPRSLVVPVSPSHYSRLVRERGVRERGVREQGVPARSPCWPCSVTPPCAWAGPLGSVGGWGRAELEEEASLLLDNLAATEALRSRSSLATIVVSPPPPRRGYRQRIRACGCSLPLHPGACRGQS